jgi:protoporphyrinogen oxidase
VIIGAGPAGLTAAYELLTRTRIHPVILEKSEHMGGLSRTVNYKGNRIDIGGHRFFSKSDRVMKWWLDRLELEHLPDTPARLAHQGQSRGLTTHGSGDPEASDRVMLIRQRKSRIFFQRKLFDYPLKLTLETSRRLGFRQSFRIGCDYARSRLFPIRPEQNLEHFFINRFGRTLYETFFKAYTEKVWGMPCDRISAEWGVQRVRGLSARKALAHLVRQALGVRPDDLSQKGEATTLIERFLYPKFGPGQMWEETAAQVLKLGGEVLTSWEVEGLCHDGDSVRAVRARNSRTGVQRVFSADYVFSTMPVQHLIRGLQPAPPQPVIDVAEGLEYRDFITVGLLCRRLRLEDAAAGKRVRIRDNWIYIQEPDARLGRLQVFNNWSPYMVADPEHIWLGLEYFCSQGDDLWSRSDASVLEFAREEMERLGIVSGTDVLDGTVIRMEKTYPAYSGSYSRFDEIRQYVDGFPNLFLIGRNGMHQYNNQDHSMLTAMVSVDNIINGVSGKANLWAVNTERDYNG